ncbi:LOW QUALITY PROTEIN: amidase [Alternaria alternata]|nr:LOW QUALITY PROTEIN: amidase [Alternaria alternata]
MGRCPARLRSMSAGNASSSSWLPFPLRRYFAQTEPASYRYHQISTEDSERESKSWYGCWRIMVLGSLLGILIIGGAVYFNRQLELCFQIQITSALTNIILAKPLPSLYEADIDAVADGLERSLFTSLHLVKASTSGKPDAMVSRLKLFNRPTSPASKK